MTMLFHYLAPLQNDNDVTSRCMQFIFEDKGQATCLIRECTCDWKRGEGKGEKSIGPWTKYGHARLNLFCPYTNKRCSIFDLPLLFLCPCPSYQFVSRRCRFVGGLNNKKQSHTTVTCKRKGLNTIALSIPSNHHPLCWPNPGQRSSLMLSIAIPIA